MKSTIALLLTLVTLIEANNPEVKHIVNGNNLFSPDIYKELYAKTETNYLVSTFSAFTGLFMLLSGAGTETAYQLHHALRISEDRDSNELGIKTLLKNFQSDNNSKLNIVHKIFIDNSYIIRRKYREKAKTIYQAHHSNVDFSIPNQAANYINDWVKKETNNDINNIINRIEISKQTKALLMQALHFRAAWDVPFDAEDTKNLTFNVNPGKSIKIKTMTREELYCNYTENEELDAKFLEIPFVGGESSMIIALPQEIDGIDNLEPQIHKILLPQNYTKQFVKVHLPRFKSEQEIDFQSALAQLGVTYIFDPARVNLSEIVGKPGDIHLERFRQKVSITVNERGVDSGSAEDPSLEIKKSCPGNTCTPITFIANHPFIYYIKIKNVIAFIGRVRNPLLKSSVKTINNEE